MYEYILVGTSISYEYLFVVGYPPVVLTNRIRETVASRFVREMQSRDAYPPISNGTGRDETRRDEMSI